MARKLVVEIIGDSRSYERALGRSSKATHRFEGSVKSMTSNVTASFATFVKGAVIFAGVDAAFRGLSNAMHAGIDEFSQMQQVSAQTQAVLASTGGVANVTAKDVDRLSQRLSKLSGVDDEAIASAENLILTFKLVRNEVGKGNDIFNRATAAALDLSKAAGGAFGDLNSTSKQLAKALNDPVRGLVSLRRAGVQFTQEQTDLIKALVETGRTLDAQKVILAEVESQVGGSAKAFGETLPGQLAKVREAFRNVFGGLVGSVAVPLADALGKFAAFIPQIEAGAKRLGVAISPIVQTIAGRLGPIIADAARIVRESFASITSVLSDNAESLRTIFNNLATTFENVWALAKPTIVFLFQVALPAALKVVIPLLKLTTGVTKVMAQTYTRVASIILKAIEKLLGGFSALADAASHLPFIGDKFAGVSDKIDVVREGIRGIASDLDAVNGKTVDVFVNVQTVRDRGAPRRTRTPQSVTPEPFVPAPVVTVETPAAKAARIRAENEAAKQAADDAVAALKKRNEAIRNAIKSEQFERIGLTATGERPTPGVGALKRLRSSLLEQIKGTTLDTSKTRQTLRRIKRVLSGEYGKVGKEVRQAILGMLNDIRSALEGGGGASGAKGPLTFTHGLRTTQIIKNLGLTVEQAEEIQRRLAHAVTPGGGGNRSTGAAAGTALRRASIQPGAPAGLPTRGDRLFVESHTTIVLDGKTIANVVTRNQQKDRRRNPSQKRGPHRK